MDVREQLRPAPARLIDGRLADASFLSAGPLSRVLACLNGDGEETRVAGGAVRNILFGVPVRDYDLATTALPDEVMARARAVGLRAIPTGVEHGTVTLVAGGVPFEVTTLRQDVETDGRRAVVRFGRDFAADAFRRDFTINGLYVDVDARVHDHVGGLADLAARRVRFIGDPSLRIAEDYLRILRLFRIHAAYGEGPVDRPALEAAIAGRAGLANLSRERIGAELLKLLAESGAPAAVSEMADAGLLGPLIGGVPHTGVFPALAAVEASKALAPDAILRLAALAVRVEEDALRLRDLLRLSNMQTLRLVRFARACLDMRGLPAPPPGAELRRLLFLHGRRAALDALLFAEARALCDRRTGAAPDGLADPDGAVWARAFAFLRDSPEPRLPFSGAELVRKGVPSGPAIGAILKRLQASWIRAGFPQDPSVLARLLDDAMNR